MKKKILIIAVLLIAVLSLIAMTNTVNAESCTNENCGGKGECTSCTGETCDEKCCPVMIEETCYPTLTKAIETVNENDVTITLRGDVTETNGVTISGKQKKITIQGNGHTIKANDDKDVITVTSSTVVLDNCKIGEESGTGVTKFGKAAGIKLENNANVTVQNKSEITAKYALWVHGSNVNLTVDDSKATGWAALDITNGSGSNTQATGNVVTVKNNSTLIGESISQDENDSYATIVLGGQKDLKLTIVDSAVKAIAKGNQKKNPQGLIASGSAYQGVTGADIEVKGNSTLDTDGENGGVIFELDKKDSSADKGNKLSIAPTVKTIGEMFPKDENTVYVTIYDRHGNEKVISVKKGEKVPETELATTDIPNGYMFRGWYTDKELKTIFNQAEAVTANISLYPGFEKTTTAEDLRTSIRALIAKAENEENMTEDLKNAVAEARAVLEETGSTYGELQEALAKLQKAYDVFKNGTISDNQPSNTPEKDKNLDTTPKTGDYIIEVTAVLTAILFANVIYFAKTKRS